jgi:hypothetical protein
MMFVKRVLLAALLVLVTTAGVLAQQPPFPPPVLQYDSQQLQGNLLHVDLTVVNWQAYAPVLFAPAPQLPPCGANPNAARTWLHVFNAVNNVRINSFCTLGSPFELQNIWFATPPSRKPKRVYVTLVDRLLKKTVQSNAVAIP